MLCYCSPYKLLPRRCAPVEDASTCIVRNEHGNLSGNTSGLYGLFRLEEAFVLVEQIIVQPASESVYSEYDLVIFHAKLRHLYIYSNRSGTSVVSSDNLCKFVWNGIAFCTNCVTYLSRRRKSRAFRPAFQSISPT